MRRSTLGPAPRETIDAFSSSAPGSDTPEQSLPPSGARPGGRLASTVMSRRIGSLISFWDPSKLVVASPPVVEVTAEEVVVVPEPKPEPELKPEPEPEPGSESAPAPAPEAPPPVDPDEPEVEPEVEAGAVLVAPWWHAPHALALLSVVVLLLSGAGSMQEIELGDEIDAGSASIAELNAIRYRLDLELLSDPWQESNNYVDKAALQGRWSAALQITSSAAREVEAGAERGADGGAVGGTDAGTEASDGIPCLDASKVERLLEELDSLSRANVEAGLQTADYRSINWNYAGSCVLASACSPLCGCLCGLCGLYPATAPPFHGIAQLCPPERWARARSSPLRAGSSSLLR